MRGACLKYFLLIKSMSFYHPDIETAVPDGWFTPLKKIATIGSSTVWKEAPSGSIEMFSFEEEMTAKESSEGVLKMHEDGKIHLPVEDLARVRRNLALILAPDPEGRGSDPESGGEFFYSIKVDSYHVWPHLLEKIQGPMLKLRYKLRCTVDKAFKKIVAPLKKIQIIAPGKQKPDLRRPFEQFINFSLHMYFAKRTSPSNKYPEEFATIIRNISEDTHLVFRDGAFFCYYKSDKYTDPDVEPLFVFLRLQNGNIAWEFSPRGQEACGVERLAEPRIFKDDDSEGTPIGYPEILEFKKDIKIKDKPVKKPAPRK
jgi:hypothetical protein